MLTHPGRPATIRCVDVLDRPRWRTVPTAALVVLPALAYALVVLAPWLLGDRSPRETGNLVAVVVTALALLGAVVAGAVSLTVLVAHARGRERVDLLRWSAVAVTSAVVLAWLLTPTAGALVTAALD